MSMLSGGDSYMQSKRKNVNHYKYKDLRRIQAAALFERKW